MKKKRLVVFDIAKAICIVLVVMGHFDIGKPEWWRITHDVIYSFHMPLFMFASGYIYIAFKKEESYKSFLWKKVKRLMIPYFATSVIVVSLKLFSQQGLYVQNPVTPMSYLRILWCPEAGYFLWFIWSLWWMFCIIPFFKTVRSRTLLLLIAFVLHYVNPFIGLPVTFCISQTAGMLLWFALGVSCFDYKDTLQELTMNIHIGWFAFLFALVEFVWINGGGQIAALVLPYLGIAFIMRFSYAISRSEHIGTYVYISSCSYIIYLFHTTFMGLARAILLKIPVMNNESDFIYTLTIAIVVTTGIICPILLYGILRRFHITRILFGLKG